MTFKQRMLLGAVCAGFLSASPARSADQPVVVVIDQTAQRIMPRIAPSAVEGIAPPGQMMSSGTNVTPQVTVRTPAGVTPVEAEMGGAVAMGLVQAMVDSAKYRKRNAEIAPLLDAVAPSQLQGFVREQLDVALKPWGFPVARTMYANGAQSGVLPRALGESDGDWAVLLSNVDGPLLTLSMENQRPLISFDIGLYKRGGRLFRRQRGAIVIYVGRSAPQPAAAVDYWSKDHGKAYLDEIHAGFAAIASLAFAPTTEPAPKYQWGDTAALGKDGAVGTARGTLIRQDDEFAYVYIGGGMTVIYHLPELASPSSTITATTGVGTP